MFWQKLGLLKSIFNKKYLYFSIYFFLMIIFADTCIKNAQFKLFYQYLLLLTKVKFFFKLIKHRKQIGVTILAVISL